MCALKITAGPFVFRAVWLEREAPRTCAAFRALLPFRNRLIQARWSGEAGWIPLGETDLGLSQENHTAHPSRGDILLYPGGISETEILFPYGSTSFACKSGPLSGNHFLSLIDGLENLPALGRLILWEGAQPITFELDQ